MGPMSRKLRALLEQPGETNGTVAEDLMAHFGASQDDDAWDAFEPPHRPYWSVCELAQHTAGFLAGQPGFRSFQEQFADAARIFQPGVPPHSAITPSCAGHWLVSDLPLDPHEGEDTIASSLLDSADVLGLADEETDALRNLAASRLGIYLHLGVRDGVPHLEELITGAQAPCSSALDFVGYKGQIWIVRLLPPLGPSETRNHLILTTPYVSNLPRKQWREYIDRATQGVKGDEQVAAYERLMKRPPVPTHWFEFFANCASHYRTDAIFVNGVPDQPHRREGRLLEPLDEPVAAQQRGLADRALFVLDDPKFRGLLGIDSVRAEKLHDALQYTPLAQVDFLSGEGPEPDDLPLLVREPHLVHVSLTKPQRKLVVELEPDLAPVARVYERGSSCVSLSLSQVGILLAHLESTSRQTSDPKELAALSRLAKALEKASGEFEAMQQIPDEKRVFDLKISLMNTDVWRRIQVQDCTLLTLHVYIQSIMNWDGSHLHVFDVDGQRFGVPDNVLTVFEEEDVWLSEVVQVARYKERFVYEYDFGDSWLHEVRLLGVFEAAEDQPYPLCVGGALAAPPEDSGGAWCFERLLTEPAAQKEWGYDPDGFSVEDATASLRATAQTAN